MDIISSRDYVNKAETVITELIDEAKRVSKNPRIEDNYVILSTSQIRKQLSMTAELFALAEQEASDTLDQDLRDRIEYLRVQFVYLAGKDQDREKPVRKFVEKAGILQILTSINGNKNDFLTFCRYMEALVAFRKFYGKEDK